MTNPEDKFYWTMKTELKLVKFLESKRYIWDPTHKQYSNAKSKEKVYVEFAERNGNKFTSQAVKERWISIRSTFSKYVRKIEASKHTDKIYKPCWRLWDACQFLYQVKLKYREDAKMRLRELIKPEPTEEDRILTALTSRVSSGDEDEAFQDEISSQNPTTAECQNIVNGITAAFKGVQHGVFGFDYNSIYGRVGKLITHRLSAMNSYEAALASKKIMEILLLYDERNPDNPNNLQLKKEY